MVCSRRPPAGGRRLPRMRGQASRPHGGTVEYGLSLGSNLGDRLALLSGVRRALVCRADVQVVAASRVYETEPVDVLPEHSDLAFLNAVLIAESRLAPLALAKVLWALEDEQGRLRGKNPNAPRPLDIDIIYAGDQRVARGRLHLPHRSWAERRFVVQPLADVRPRLVLPGQTATVSEILAALPAEPAVVPWPDSW